MSMLATVALKREVEKQWGRFAFRLNRRHLWNTSFCICRRVQGSITLTAASALLPVSPLQLAYTIEQEIEVAGKLIPKSRLGNTSRRGSDAGLSYTSVSNHYSSA